MLDPPITQEDAERILGEPVPPAAWGSIRAAFRRYGDALDDLEASKASKKKDDPKSWHARQAKVSADLEKAMDLLERARRHGNFLREATENYSIKTFGYSAGAELSASRKINDAYRLILDALVVVERAEPIEAEIPTLAAAQAGLVREVAAALEGNGLSVALSDGRKLDAMPEGARHADLSPFEQLVAAFGIGDEQTTGERSLRKPAAFAAWMRAAMRGGNRGKE